MKVLRIKIKNLTSISAMNVSITGSFVFCFIKCGFATNNRIFLFSETEKGYLARQGAFKIVPLRTHVVKDSISY